MNKTLKLIGHGASLPESGSVRFGEGAFYGGIASLSHGLCEMIGKAFPDQKGFDVRMTITPTGQNDDAAIELIETDRSLHPSGFYWLIDHPDYGFWESITYQTKQDAVTALINGTILWMNQD